MKKSFTQVRRGLTEELTHKKLAPMVDSFVAFASKDLGIKSRPEVSLIPQGKESRSFGGFSPADNKIMIVTKNRHPMDIFRTLAHELVHCKQCEDGKIGKDIRKEGETGSPQENEANAQAGVLMRNYAKMYPNMFDASYVTEETTLEEGINDPGNNKAVFLFGGPGSGKDYILSQTLQNHGLTELNSDIAFEYLLGKAGLDPKMPDSEAEAREPVRARAKQITKKKQKYLFDNNRGIIINGTGDDLEKVALMKDELERRGYDTKGLMVHTSDEVSKQRNIERGERGGRTVPEDIRQTKWDDVQANRPGFAKLFGDDYTEVDNTADLRKVDKETRERKLAEFGKIYSTMSKWSRTEAQAPAAQEYRQKEMQARGITQEPTTRATRVSTRPSAPRPASVQVSDDHLSQARRLGLSYFGFGRFGRNIKGKNVVTHTVQNNQLVAKPVKIQEDLRQWFSKTHPKGDWVRLDTKGNIKGPCAREEGEGKPKCLNRSRAESMPKEKRAEAARRKRTEDPVADREGKGGKPVMVATEAKSWAQQAAIAIAKKKSGKYDKEGKKLKEEILSEKNEPTNPELWSRAKSLAKKKFDVYPSAYANGWAAKWYKSKGGGWKTVSEENNSELDENWFTDALGYVRQKLVDTGVVDPKTVGLDKPKKLSYSDQQVNRAAQRPPIQPQTSNTLAKQDREKTKTSFDRFKDIIKKDPVLNTIRDLSTRKPQTSNTLAKQDKGAEWVNPNLSAERKASLEKQIQAAKAAKQGQLSEARRKRKDSEPDEENVPMSKTSDTGGTSKVGYPTRPMAEGMIKKFFERRMTSKAKDQLTKRFLEQKKKHKESGGKITPGEIVKFSPESTARRVADDLGIPHRTAFDHLRKAGHLAEGAPHQKYIHPDRPGEHVAIPHSDPAKPTGFKIAKTITGGKNVSTSDATDFRRLRKLAKKHGWQLAEDLDTDFEMFLENAGEWGTDELAINYTDATPGQEYWKKKKKKKDVKEDYAAPMWYGFGNSDGKSGLLPTATRNTPMTTSGFTGAGPSIPMAEEEPVDKKKKKKSIKDMRNEAENNLYFKTKEQGLPTNKGPDNFVPFTPAGVGSIKEEKHPALVRAGVEGFSKPKRTPGHPKKSHIVVVKDGDKVKTIRFGEQGAETAGAPKEGESDRMKKKRKSFKSRHRRNIAKGKTSAAYWADKVKW